jgi:hypothetical protein
VGRVATNEAVPTWSARAVVDALAGGWAALIAFVAYAVAAGVWVLVTFGDRLWFKGDEWGFLVGRSLAEPAGLFVPQNTHWSTVPIVTYQTLYGLFGLGSYVPYLATVLGLHLLLAGLLRVVMRRADVGPWISTFVAGSFVLFGTGWWNILFGVQISMVTSMVCAVAHLILADHDGPFDRRDLAGLIVGVVGLMASGIAIPMLAVVALGVWLRRDWRLAAWHTVPLVVLYGAWAFWQEPLDQAGTDPLGHLPEIARWVGRGLVGVPESIGQHPVVAVALALVTVVGLALAWVPLGWSGVRRAGAVPFALGVGAVALLGSAATQRYPLGPDAALASHYQSMATALLLPAVAVAIAAFARRWRVAGPILVGLVLLGVPGNIAAFTLDPEARVWAEYAGQRNAVLGAAASPLAEQVARDVHPLPGRLRADELTMGFLLDGVDTGRVPAATAATDKVREQVDTRLALSQAPADPVPVTAACLPSSGPIELAPDVGDRFSIGTGTVVVRRADGPDARYGAPVAYSGIGTTGGSELTVQLPGQRFQVAPEPPATTFTWCPLGGS